MGHDRGHVVPRRRWRHLVRPALLILIQSRPPVAGPLTNRKARPMVRSVRTLTAIVLLFWAVCYGRCLAEQYGAHDSPEPQQAWCAHQCCHQEKPDVPPPAPLAPCGLCDFVKSGGTLPGGPMILDVPVFFCLPVPESDWCTASTLVLFESSPELEGPDTGPPRVLRICEWMASTAAPVRGPNPCA